MIPIHILANKHGIDKCKCLLALHHLTGSDYTSKVGTKHSGLVANPSEYLNSFAEGKIKNLINYKK